MGKVAFQRRLFFFDLSTEESADAGSQIYVDTGTLMRTAKLGVAAAAAALSAALTAGHAHHAGHHLHHHVHHSHHRTTAVHASSSHAVMSVDALISEINVEIHSE